MSSKRTREDDAGQDRHEALRQPVSPTTTRATQAAPHASSSRSARPSGAQPAGSNSDDDDNEQLEFESGSEQHDGPDQDGDQDGDSDDMLNMDELDDSDDDDAQGMSVCLAREVLPSNQYFVDLRVRQAVDANYADINRSMHSHLILSWCGQILQTGLTHNVPLEPIRSM